VKDLGCFVKFQGFSLVLKAASANEKCVSTWAARQWKDKRVPELAFKHQHRVTYGECTVGNHVYYARYLDMLEEARGEFFRRVSRALREWQESGRAFPVIGVQVDYKGPARYDDLVTIELWITELRGVRLNMGFRMVQEDGRVVAEGETRHVCASLNERPQRLPKELIERLEPFVRLPSDAH
jgi:acyl-CoA thioester hydrolase